MKTKKQVSVITAIAGLVSVAGLAFAVILSGGGFESAFRWVSGLAGTSSGGNYSVTNRIAHGYGLDGSVMSGGAYSLEPAGIPQFVPSPGTTPYRPTLAPGDATIIGGVKGYADLRAEERVNVFFNPKESGSVSVKIYSVKGQLVLDRSVGCSAGNQDSIAWDGRNSSGERVASGVYIVRVRGAGVDAVKRTAVVQ